jgi:uncharacterized coiled-coil protein SlyX
MISPTQKESLFILSREEASALLEELVRQCRTRTRWGLEYEPNWFQSVVPWLPLPLFALICWHRAGAPSTTAQDNSLNMMLFVVVALSAMASHQSYRQAKLNKRIDQLTNILRALDQERMASRPQHQEITPHY